MRYFGGSKGSVFRERASDGLLIEVHEANSRE